MIKGTKKALTPKNAIPKIKPIQNEPLTIDLTKLNESDVFEVWLEMPDGGKYDFGGYDCLKISTIIENGI